MDNSEEDASTATIASRRLEAREKELRTGEEALVTVASVRDASAAPTTGDEVSDFDSMPSPGVSDANTSTEAILDMIDEFVDGPTAARRIQCSDESESPPSSSATSSSSKANTSCTESTGFDVKHSTQCMQNPSHNEHNAINILLQSKISESEPCENRVPDVSESSESFPAEFSFHSELPSSSAYLTIESSENSVRTVKSFTSSDSSEQLINDSVESTSNDNSVSVNKLEVSTHSPLKRRLVRPAPSDRPSDCTVSSTVDSQSVDVHNTELKSGEFITKDVSSSSDAVPVNVNPEEIRHISEVSLCQAETSVSPPKKIKLVRPKPPLDSSESSTKSISLPDNERCQSTSSEQTLLPICITSMPGCSSTDLPNSSITNEHKDNIVSTKQQPTNDVQDNSSSENLPKSQLVCSESKQIEQQISFTCVSSIGEPSICNQKHIESNNPVNIQPSVTNSELTIPQNTETKIELCSNESTQSSQTLDATEQLDSKSKPLQPDPESEKKVPPLKLCVQRSTDIASENDIQKRVPPLKLTVPCKESSKLNKDETERKVPPLKLCKSYESPMQVYVDGEKPIETEKKVPPLKIHTQASELSPKSLSHASQTERKVPPIRISATSGEFTPKILTDVDSEKKVPPFKISTQSVETIIVKVDELNDNQKKIQPIKLNTHELYLNDSSKVNTLTGEKVEDLEKRVPPIKLFLAVSGGTLESTFDSKSDNLEEQSLAKPDILPTDAESKQIPKLTIKIQKTEETNSPVPKLTIKQIKPPAEAESRKNAPEQIPSITKLNIKPIRKPAEKINEIHRKSSSSEISESEYSENDDATSTSDQASVSDQGPLEEVPKVAMNLGQLSNEIAPNIPKLTIKGLQNCDSADQDGTKLKLVIAQPEEEQLDKVPKLTIKNLSKSDQPLSPKLTIKPIKPPLETSSSDGHPIPKLVISTSESTSMKENAHVSKITIKPVMKNAPDSPVKSKRCIDAANIDNIPTITKLNIKPVIKPDNTEIESTDVKVPIISKLNIKPVLKPHAENEVESIVDDIPKVTKINIKPLKPPEDISASKAKDCDDINSSSTEKSIPTITKLNIKPIIKPDDEDKVDSENQSSETGNSSDDNADVPVVTKINIKPISKPSDIENTNFKEEKIPIITKLNIKPILDPTETAPLSPKLVTKLNIKPIVNPDELDRNMQSNENEQNVSKNPPLLMKINKRIINESNEKCNNKIEHYPCNNIEVLPDLSKNVTMNCVQSTTTQISMKHNIDSLVLNIENHDVTKSLEPATEESTSTVNELKSKSEIQKGTQISDVCESVDVNKVMNSNKLTSFAEALSKHESTKSTVQNCKLLKQLLEQDSSCSDKYSEQSKMFISKDTKSTPQMSVTIEEDQSADKSESPSIVMENNTQLANEIDKDTKSNKNIVSKTKLQSSHDTSEDVTIPLEINTERVASPCSGQDSPRIILKINKTDHGSSAQIITEERPETPKNIMQEEITEKLNETPSAKKTRRKQILDTTSNETVGKRLRSSKVVQNAEQSPVAKRNAAKRQTMETVPCQNKQTDMTVLEAKRLRLGQILSNKTLSVTKVSQTPANKPLKQDVKNINHNLLNNENCSKNGNSQLHKILSNLQAKQMQVMPLNDIITTKKSPIFTDVRKDEPLVSIVNAAVTEVSQNENSHLKVTDMIINDSSESRDIGIVPKEVSQDAFDVENKTTPDVNEIIQTKELETPTPRKRGRPRKLPISEDSKPIGLPTPALEERPQRSLRLSRERPAILAKPRGRGRGRGAKRCTPPAEVEPIVEKANKFFEKTPEDLDPTSSRVKLPRMTEALDKMPSVCSTPLSSRRHSDSMDRLSAGSPDLKVVLDTLPKMDDALMRSPESVMERVRGRRGGRGSRGGRGRGTPKTPRARGKVRGGGKGAMYMRETMGIYGRVCGPATTTVELFEEEAQMMEDSATPAKPSHLLDEDSQSSIMSSTNDSSKLKKSKFADLFDSNKVWTAADVKEYTWSTPDAADDESQVMMIQEQVAMFLSVKSFKRRYPELKRRTIVGEEREYVLSKGVVTEALCDLGITAVEASEVLDIMLSDYPHKYEEYRTYQRDKQLADMAAEENEPKPEVKDRMEMKIEKLPEKQEPKVDPEKTRQDMAAAAIASASEFNTRINASRRPAVVDLQSMVIHRRRPPVMNPPMKMQPPGGFYPHALLPGQYQHGYKVYTSEQLRYFPLNTVLTAPPAPPSPLPSSSESDDDSSSSSDDDAPAKRKKLTKTKRTSDDVKKEEDPDEKVDLCRVCNLRLEANRRYTHERFLVCSSCDNKLHPSCLDLNADTIRKCREYSWQCADCKCCATCSKKQDDEKMLFCDLCDRGFHIYCVGLPEVPTGRWHCVECAICKSCGARDPNGPPSVNPGSSGTPDTPSFSGAATPGTSGPAEWHHQTKRGPGGHKVYSHSLCTPCARAYRIGRYCPLCDRSFVGPKGTMQLIICKLCDRQHHKDCVKQTVSNVNVLDYTCAECRRSGITSRSAAVRNAPRTIATLFMAKRRFNKYAHRQYMQSRLQAAQKETDVDPIDPIDFEDECSEDITEVSDPLEGTAPDGESLPMDYGD